MSSSVLLSVDKGIYGSEHIVIHEIDNFGFLFPNF